MRRKGLQARFMKLPRKPKKKLVLPLFLIFLFSFIFLLGRWQKTEIDFDFDWLGGGKLVKPVPNLTDEENLENMFKQSGLGVESLNFSPHEVEASLSGKLTVFLDLEKDLSSQILSLQFILSRSKIEGKTLQVVDLRYTKPVVSY